MTPERWQAVKNVLCAVLELKPEERSAYLNSACGSDSSLRREVESLLASGDDIRSSFLQSPPAADLLTFAGSSEEGVRAAVHSVKSLQRQADLRGTERFVVQGGLQVPRSRAPWWMYVIAASFLAFFALLYYSDFFGPDLLGASFGFPFENPKGRIVFISAPMGPAFEHAGAKPGDYLVRVDGQELYTVSDWIAIAANLEVGRRVRLGLDRGGRQFEAEATLERPELLGSIDSVIWLVSHASGFLILLVSLFIAFSRPWDVSARLGACFWRQERSLRRIICRGRCNRMAAPSSQKF
jgi:hypothetical protein